jgi:ubiquinone/menaquinone biosynthesis C-methylase UbiE
MDANSFNEQVSEPYQDLLTSLLFDGFSSDLVNRIDFSNTRDILELASGSGNMTRKLLTRLPRKAHLLATDPEPERRQHEASNLSWDVVDMTSIPYVDEQFDLIICQFGLMHVSDKLKALTEIHRVMKKGGKLFISVWGNILSNPLWNISGNVIERFLGSNPILQDPGLFSLADKQNTMKLLNQAGFHKVKASMVSQNGTIESAKSAAKGVIQEPAVLMALNETDSSMILKIQEVLEAELSASLGNHPLYSPLMSWLFEITK